ncbi:hypothetical protein DH86_00004316, partial [Scytalidium sp. 3C]
VGGYAAYRAAVAERKASKASKYLSKLLGVSLVVLFLLCILLGPEFNNANSDHRLFELCPEDLYIWYRLLLFMVLIIGAIAAKLVVPNQVQLSYAPAALTFLAEATYLLIDLTCAVLDLLLLEWIPSLLWKLGKFLALVWASVLR